jgi:LmbE family N-acetylglucosaminyl deacetylase
MHWRIVRIVGVLVALGAGAWHCQQALAAAAVLPRIDANTSLLVVSPHPDDETLCCAGLVQRVLAAGGTVNILWLTSGDGSALGMLMVKHRLLADAAAARELGARRMREARAAASLLGVPATQQLFLGYPDGGLPQLLSSNRSAVYRAPYTQASSVPYQDALFPGHPYTGESLERDFAAVLKRVAPTMIAAPSPRDGHPDHRAAGLLVAAAARGGTTAATLFWVVHGGEGWPSPRGLEPGLPLMTAPLMQGVPSTTLELSVHEEDRKLDAVREYHTQLQVLAPLLLAFVRTSELYTSDPGLSLPAAAAR